MSRPDRAFHISDVLSAVTGVVLSRRGEPGVEAFYSYVLGRPVHLPDVEHAFLSVREHVLRTHPMLDAFYGIEVPTYELAGVWVRRRAREFGAYLRVPALPDAHPLRDPTSPSPPPRTRPPYPPTAVAADRYAEQHAAVLAVYARIRAGDVADFGPAGAPSAPRADGAAEANPEQRDHPDGGVGGSAGSNTSPPGEFADGWHLATARRPRRAGVPPDARVARRAAFNDLTRLHAVSVVPCPGDADATTHDVSPRPAASTRVPYVPVFVTLANLALFEGAPPPTVTTVFARSRLGPADPFVYAPTPLSTAL